MGGDAAVLQLLGQHLGGARFLARLHGIRIRTRRRLGEAVQIEAMKSKLKVPQTSALTCKSDNPLLSIAFNFNLRRYTSESTGTDGMDTAGSSHESP
jgi:hypothetical protein